MLCSRSRGSSQSETLLRKSSFNVYTPRSVRLVLTAVREAACAWHDPVKRSMRAWMRGMSARRRRDNIILCCKVVNRPRRTEGCTFHCDSSLRVAYLNGRKVLMRNICVGDLELRYVRNRAQRLHTRLLHGCLDSTPHDFVARLLHIA